MLDEEWLIDLFSPFGEVRVRRFFGGQGVYLDGLMIGLVAGGVLYFKADAETTPEFDAAGLPPFSYERKTGRRTVMSYRRAPGDVLENPDAMAPWVGLALKAAHRAEAKKAAPRARARSGTTKKPRGAGTVKRG